MTSGLDTATLREDLRGAERVLRTCPCPRERSRALKRKQRAERMLARLANIDRLRKQREVAA